MNPPSFDITPFIHQDEGQHYERKSLLEGPEGNKRSRDRRQIRDQVAHTAAGFANADGGVLVLGIEDDHSITGHQLPAQALASLLTTPCSRLIPPQAPGFTVQADGRELIVFDVPAADSPVQVAGDGFPLRIGDQTLQVSESQIQALKLQGFVESWESRTSHMSLEQLDPELMARARHGAGLSALSDEDYLLKRKLADRRGARIQLRRAAELLFATHGTDHPNAGVRVFRVIGTERRTGPEHNVEELPRIEGNLPAVIVEAFSTVARLLRRPSRLFGSRFRAVPEYPEFSWKEALLNAVAHRDYSVEGLGTEIWLFEDRMEINSPGGLVGDLTLDDVLSLQRIHRSRNPRLMRVLVDLGVARDQGEGIPRMFAEMQDAFLPKPEIQASTRSVRLTLHNTPTLSSADREFVSRLDATELTDEEFRALLHAHRLGRVENGDLRLLVGLDTLKASYLLRRLRDRGLLELHARGANSFYTLPDAYTDRSGSEEQNTDRVKQNTDRVKQNTDRVKQNADRGKQNADRVKQNADRVKQNADRGKQNADRGKQNTDRVKQNTDRGKQNTDRGKQNTDRVKQNADRGKQNADRGKQNADRVKQNADRGKQNADRGKQNTDRVKQNTDRGKQNADRGKQNADRGKQNADRGKQNADRGKQITDRGKQITDRGKQITDRGKQITDRVKQNADRGKQSIKLPRQISTVIADLSLRPRKEQLRQVIMAICAFREWTTPAELAVWLDILPDNLTVRHLSPMTKSGQLERRYPDIPTHSDQAYRSPDRRWQLLLTEVQ